MLDRLILRHALEAETDRCVISGIQARLTALTTIVDRTTSLVIPHSCATAIKILPKPLCPHSYLPAHPKSLQASAPANVPPGMGFSNGGDTNRKKFTGYQRDTETGLDYAQARYYGNTQGRFTSPDPFSGSATIANPQTFNRYAYCGNNPVSSTNPTSLAATGALQYKVRQCRGGSPQRAKSSSDGRA